MAIAVVGIAVAGGVYYGLERTFPRHAAEDVAAVPPAPAEPAASTAASTEAPAEFDASAVETAPVAASEPAAEPEPVAEAAPEPEPEPAPATPPPSPPKPRIQIAKAEPAVPAKKAPPAADIVTAWWPDPSKMAPGQLKLKYAGQTQGKTAIALLFSAPLRLDSLNQNVEVRDAEGHPIGGTWELGKNTRLAVFAVDKPGRYTVILQPALADSTGHLLGTPLQGPVYIQ